MKITMLGTGNAMVTECYNTCFVLEDEGRCLLVDGGGGNTVLRNLKYAGYAVENIAEILVTHKHVDHIMGIIWMIRAAATAMNQGRYEGELRIYGHDEVIELIRGMALSLLQGKQTKLIGERIHLVTVTDGEEFELIGHNARAFDIHSTKAKQFGFTIYYEGGKKLTCCGDEPYSECEREYAEGSDWLLHEAFCLYSEANIFKPYEKHHSTVKEACETAGKLGVKNLVLYHTEEKNLTDRKRLYTAEGRQYYTGNLFVPDDMETIEIL